MIYKGDCLREIIFPLGGIGTGSIGISGEGRLCDWEIFNRPDKGSYNGYTHICVIAETDNKRYVKILNGDLTKELMGRYSKRMFGGYGFGPDGCTMSGFPHFKDVKFRGEFPFAVLTFTDDNFPGKVELTAYNPFIPNNADDSGIPAAFFSVKFINTTKFDVRFSAVFSLRNPFEQGKNEEISGARVKGVKLLNAAVEDKNAIGFGDLTIATDKDCAGVQEYWYRGGWQDSIVTFYNEVSCGVPLSSRHYDAAGTGDHCSVFASMDCEPGKEDSVRFVLSWNYPNNYNYWTPHKDETGKDKQWKNYYSKRFSDSECSARYAFSEWDRLYLQSLAFCKELYSCTLDSAVIDAVASNLCVLKSPTVLRLENGEFYGWEGVHEQAGSCEGSCQHVWNYAYALCFLFPELERTMREVEVKYALDDNGKTHFRVMLPLGEANGPNRSCLDGQMGTVIKIYREWKLGGGDEWLKQMWPSVKKMLAYAWSAENPDKWDANHDGVLEGRQHHTLDMEVFGPSSWLEGFYLGALKAAAVMAEYLGDTETQNEYSELFAKGYEWSKNNLFNGEYFYQKIDLHNRQVVDMFDCADTYWNEEKKQIKYQIGEGSEIDQLCGQWHADICGLGDIFDREQRKTALKSMYKYNFKPSVREFVNPWRIFAVNDDAATVICVYPDKAEKPAIPVPYCEESMTGLEYQFAGSLIAADMVREGISVVRAVRARYKGFNRNPYNEIECGSNYARSMASFALIPILSGFLFDLPHKTIGFYPRISAMKFRCIWSVDGAWGNVVIKEHSAEINICSGSLRLVALGFDRVENVKKLTIDGKQTDFTIKDGMVKFDENVIMKKIKIKF